jgi:hypothetical protein
MKKIYFRKTVLASLVLSVKYRVAVVGQAVTRHADPGIDIMNIHKVSGAGDAGDVNNPASRIATIFEKCHKNWQTDLRDPSTRTHNVKSIL